MARSTHVRWTVGNALRGTARQREAIEALGRARAELVELGLTIDAALAALGLADALLVNEQAEQVPLICREAIAYLTKAGLTEQALPGLALLREAAAMGKASVIRETRAKGSTSASRSRSERLSRKAPDLHQRDN